MHFPSLVSRWGKQRQDPTESHPYVNSDIEKQHQQRRQSGAAAPSANYDAPFSQSSYQSTNFPPPSAALLQFQALTGIVSPPYLQGGAPETSFLGLSRLPNSTRVVNASRAASNQGVYTRTVEEEQRAQSNYNLSKWAVNTFYLLQIVIGAALTALGAASGPSAAVTVLGALNTIIAGLLTYLKGQGLPTRLEAYVHQLRALREYIEERERRFMQDGGIGLSVEAEVARIFEMYQEVRQTAQDNRPGTVLPPRGLITGILKKPDIERKDVIQPVGDKAPVDVLKHGFRDLQEFRKTLHKTEDNVDSSTSHMTGDMKEHGSGMKGEVEHLGGLMGKIIHRTEHDAEDGAQTLREEKDREMSSAKREVEHVGDMFKGALHKGLDHMDRKVWKEDAGPSNG